MTDGTDQATWPSPQGPWPEVRDLSRLYDHGRWWCANAAGHPGDDGYPDPTRHVPWDECQTPEAWIDGACQDLDGPPLEVSVYAAAAYRYGQSRRVPVQSPTRLVVDAWEAGKDDARGYRLSMSLGEAARLARVLNHMVDLISATPTSSSCVSPGCASPRSDN